MHTAPIPSLHAVSLKQRVLNAGVWSLAGYGLSLGLRFASNLLMTRLLAPELFGVMAIAMMVLVGLAMFSDFGLKQSVIQSKRGHDPRFLNTAWVIQIVRGVMLWLFALSVGLLLFLADRTGMVPGHTVYADPNLPYVIAVLSIITVIHGLQSTKLFEASRNLALGQVTIIEFIAQVAGFVCMIAWVSVDRSIWALVSGNVCTMLVSASMSHAGLPGVPNRWEWDRSAFREIVHFGKWIFLASILGFLVANGDRVLLGGFVSTTVLGVYVIAFLIFSAVDQVLTKIISEVAFPAFSEISRQQPTDLKASYYRFHFPIASFAYFCSGILILSGQPLVSLLYDQRYHQAGWMLQVLAVALMAVPFRLAAHGFIALGAPHIYSHLLTIRSVALFVVLPLGFYLFGLPGALWGIVVAYYSFLPTTIFYMLRYGLFDLRRELIPLPIVLAGIGVAELFNLAVGP